MLYHLVFPAKYRRVVIDKTVDEVLKDVCLKLGKRCQVNFLKIETDRDVFKRYSEVKKKWS